MVKLLLAFGTRPEAIKLAPVYNEMRRRKDRIRLICCVTGQHRDLLDPVLSLFEMTADHDLNIIEEDQSLFHITASVLTGMRTVLLEERPDMIVVQGDTTSAFAAALAAFYLKTPVAHVEAGLRSYDKFQPYPEEINRAMISRVADLNFCPTQRAADNLIRENVPPSSIHITGNTVIDALLHTVKRLDEDAPAAPHLPGQDLPPGRMILVTGHRRENFGKGLEDLSLSLVDLVEKFSDVNVVYSVHPNPNVKKPVERILGGHERIRVIPPPDYVGFVALMKEASFIITDSGGIQEEAPSLKKPVLIARNVTERPEAVQCGAALIVGADRARIVREASRLLTDPQHFSSMIIERNPFGDGNAAANIVDLIEDFLAQRKNTGRK